MMLSLFVSFIYICFCVGFSVVASFKYSIKSQNLVYCFEFWNTMTHFAHKHVTLKEVFQ